MKGKILSTAVAVFRDERAKVSVLACMRYERRRLSSIVKRRRVQPVGRTSVLLTVGSTASCRQVAQKWTEKVLTENMQHLSDTQW